MNILSGNIMIGLIRFSPLWVDEYLPDLFFISIIIIVNIIIIIVVIIMILAMMMTTRAHMGR